MTNSDSPITVQKVEIQEYNTLLTLKIDFRCDSQVMREIAEWIDTMNGKITESLDPCTNCKATEDECQDCMSQKDPDEYDSDDVSNWMQGEDYENERHMTDEEIHAELEARAEARQDEELEMEYERQDEEHQNEDYAEARGRQLEEIGSYHYRYPDEV